MTSARASILHPPAPPGRPRPPGASLPHGARPRAVAAPTARVTPLRPEAAPEALVRLPGLDGRIALALALAAVVHAAALLLADPRGLPGAQGPARVDRIEVVLAAPASHRAPGGGEPAPAKPLPANGPESLPEIPPPAAAPVPPAEPAPATILDAPAPAEPALVAILDAQPPPEATPAKPRSPLPADRRPRARTARATAEAARQPATPPAAREPATDSLARSSTGEASAAPAGPAPTPAKGRSGTGAAAAGIDAEAAPTVRVPPTYPLAARSSRTEGTVLVEFTVLPDGSVSDPRVLQASAPGVFDRSVLRAIVQWRFAPRVEDGQAVSRRARQTVRFSLAS